MESKQNLRAQSSSENLNETSQEDVLKYRKLKAQEAWIKMNKETLDRMEKHKNGLLRILVIVSLINLFLNLLILFL